MLKFNDFETLNERAEHANPKRIESLIRAFVNLQPEISVDPWPERVIKEGEYGEFIGIRMYLDDMMFRINWREGSSEPTIIDVWDSRGKNQMMPTMSLIGNYDIFKFASSSIIDTITSIAKSGNIRKVVTTDVHEAESKGMTPRIVPAPPEQTDDVVQPQSDFENDEFNVFDELRSLVIMVINNVNPSLIITGRGGIGKTHTVMKTLDEFDLVKDEEYVVVKGAATPLSMYKALYDNNEKIVIFDDCDSIFKDADGVNILKAALDSYDEREISWLSRSTYDPETQSPTPSKPVPNRFIFDGQIIFISNMPMEKVDAAVRTRSYTIDINLTEEQIFNIMEKNLPNILPNVDINIKKEVFYFMKNEYKKPSTEGTINVRTLIKAIKIRLSGAPNWKVLATKYA
jgi:hypothetical protein